MLEKQINSIHNVYHVSDGWNLASISYAEVQDMTVAMDIYGERGQVLYLGLHSNFIRGHARCTIIALSSSTCDVNSICC